MTVKQEIWEFALTNPEYWEVLRSDKTPDVLEPGDVDAFQAAREVVQHRLIQLVRACGDELNLRSEGTALAGVFSKNVWDSTILKNRAEYRLPKHRAWLRLSLARWSANSMALYASVWVAKKRRSQARDLLPSAQEEEKGWLWYALEADHSLDSASQARAFVEVFWGELLAFQSSAPVAADVDDDDDSPADDQEGPE